MNIRSSAKASSKGRTRSGNSNRFSSNSKDRIRNDSSNNAFSNRENRTGSNNIRSGSSRDKMKAGVRTSAASNRTTRTGSSNKCNGNNKGKMRISVRISAVNNNGSTETTSVNGKGSAASKVGSNNVIGKAPGKIIAPEIGNQIIARGNSAAVITAIGSLTNAIADTLDRNMDFVYSVFPSEHMTGTHDSSTRAIG